MKKLLSIIMVILAAVSSGATVFARETSEPVSALTAQMPANPHPEAGDLIDTTVNEYPDGIVVYEYLYITPQITPYDNHHGTKNAEQYGYITVRTNNGSEILCKYKVNATFFWDEFLSNVRVKSTKGTIVYNKGTSKISYENIKTTGDGTKKATVKYAFDRGGKSWYAQVSCDYKGNVSGKAS